MYLKLASIFFVLLLMTIAHAANAWEVDFSRRQKQLPAKPVAASASASEEVKPQNAVPAEDGDKEAKALPPKRNWESLVKRAAAPVYTDRQEVVILNTAKGFVPSNVRLRKGVHYKIHVVNVNEDKKNVSFMLDAFNQHYATYYGQLRSFDLDPDKEGIFEFQCPETSSSGKVVVFGPNGSLPAERVLSSER